jgi:hypothetical protein
MRFKDIILALKHLGEFLSYRRHRTECDACGCNLSHDFWNGFYVATLFFVTAPMVYISLLLLDDPMINAFGWPTVRAIGQLVALLSVVNTLFLALTFFGDPGVVLVRDAKCITIDHIREREERFEDSAKVSMCSSCDLFIEGYVRHCNVIGSCIGRRNTWSYVLLLGTFWGYALVMFSLVVVYLSKYPWPDKRPESFGELRQLATSSVAVAVWLGLMFAWAGTATVVLWAVMVYSAGTNHLTQRDRWDMGTARGHEWQWRRVWQILAEARRWRTTYAAIKDVKSSSL